MLLERRRWLAFPRKAQKRCEEHGICITLPLPHWAILYRHRHSVLDTRLLEEHHSC